ncbi:MAG: hypothetical protein AAF938_26350 [Myxococcota bacterium]
MTRATRPADFVCPTPLSRRGARRFLPAALVAAAALLISTGAHAQSAEELFERANRAADANQMIEARDLYRASLRAEESLGAWFNLALVLRRTGEPSESVDILVRILLEEHGPLDSNQRAEAQRQLEGARAELVLLTVRVSGEPATVEIDGAVAGETANERLSVSLNPGSHDVRATRGDTHSDTLSVVLIRGEPMALRLTLESAEAIDGAVVEDDEQDESISTEGPRDRRRLRRGLGYGAAAVVLIGAIVLTAFAVQGPSDPPGDVLPRTQTLMVR